MYRILIFNGLFGLMSGLYYFVLANWAEATEMAKRLGYDDSAKRPEIRRSTDSH